jgi:hypothetical protein
LWQPSGYLPPRFHSTEFRQENSKMMQEACLAMRAAIYIRNEWDGREILTDY